MLLSLIVPKMPGPHLPMSQAYAIAVAGTPLPALSYRGPSGLPAGTRVLVPLGSRQAVGLILGPDTQPATEPDNLRELIAPLDETPLWTEAELALLAWVQRYYHAPWGRVLETALPPGLRQPRQSKRRSRPLGAPPPPAPQLLSLNDEQQQIVDRIRQQRDTFTRWLLQGVTGSGKTEVYARLIADTLQAGQQVLLLVPEIGLTPQTLERLRQRLGTDPVLLHSGLTEATRAKVWHLCASGAPLLLIGTRSAVFAPLPGLGLILVDEEHDNAYKQQDGIRYHARDVAIMRAHGARCPILLGTATPSLESLANVEQGKYQLLELTQRANNRPLPALGVIDLRAQTLKNGLSVALINAIRTTLADDGQVLLFLNRRGYAPVLMCHACGGSIDCPACDVPYTFHRTQPQLRCHHCGRVAHLPSSCPHCGAQDWTLVGQGTQRLEQELAELFPGTPLLRIDRDSTQKRDDLPQLLSQVREGHARLILGTQMLAKGHDFAGVALVGIVDVDGALFARDFRALEHLAQLVTQVAGRAGRGDKPGQVLLQTHQPSHAFVQALLTQPYASLARQLLTERKAAQLPPYTHSAYLLAESKQLERVQQQLTDLMIHLQHHADAQTGVQIWGPMPALMHRRQHHYRELLWLQASSRPALHHLLDQAIHWLNDRSHQISGVRVSLDVDPIDMP